MGATRVGSIMLRREVVLVVVLFVLGLAAGLYFGRLLGGEPRSAPNDYAVLVARLYEGDNNKDLAIARLKAGGVDRPAEAVAAIAATYPTSTAEQARDAESLRRLASALGASTASGTALVSIPTGYLLVGLVALAALGLVVLLAGRILGLRMPAVLTAPGLGRAGQPSGRHRTYPPAPNAAAAVTWTSAGDTPASEAESSSPAQAKPASVAERKEAAPAKATAPAAHAAFSHVRTRPMQPGESASTGSNGRSKARSDSPTPIRPVPSRPAPVQRGYSFRSSYRLGDEPYDEIHPISVEPGHSLVGACGVKASRFLLDQGQKRYWGFTAWLHDYAHDGNFRAVGLVSRWAHDHFADEIDDWRNEGDIDEVRLVNFDQDVELETVHLTMRMSIEDVDYVQGVPPEAVFNRLAAQFEVDLRRAAASGGREQTGS